MYRKIAFIVFCLLLFQGAGQAQKPAQKVSYDSLLEKVKKQDAGVNFQELRLAYTETKQYNPYGADRESRNAMFAAVRDEDNEKALALSEKILTANYLDIYGHIGAYAANKHLGHSEKSDYHRYVYENLLKSIKDSGDGKTIETAFVVISTDEEYALFSFMGVRATAQALIEDKNHHYDKMTVTDPEKNQTITYYFNVDKPFAWLGSSLKN